MIQQVVEVENKLGLHARAAAKLVRLVSSFSSRILVSREGTAEVVEAGSILGILMLAAARGSRLVFSIDGQDEMEAGEAIRELFAGRFGEES
jgi:phosphotransferase system HPr (HPr) family protein